MFWGGIFRGLGDEGTEVERVGIVVGVGVVVDEHEGISMEFSPPPHSTTSSLTPFSFSSTSIPSSSSSSSFFSFSLPTLSLSISFSFSTAATLVNGDFLCNLSRVFHPLHLATIQLPNHSLRSLSIFTLARSNDTVL